MFAHTINRGVQKLLVITVASFIFYSIIQNSYELGWWWIAFWFAATIGAGVVVGIPNGFIAAGMTMRERAMGGTKPFDRIAGLSWLVASVVITWAVCTKIANWMV